MRISDWSSDVCSSDLAEASWRGRSHVLCTAGRGALIRPLHICGIAKPVMHACHDRKSVVWGTSVSVRVDLGGRRIIQKTTPDTIRYSRQAQTHTTSRT